MENYARRDIMSEKQFVKEIADINENFTQCNMQKHSLLLKNFNICAEGK